MHAFIFVIKAIVVTFPGIFSEKAHHLVLVKSEVTAVAVGIFVVGVELTALAVGFTYLCVF